MSWHSALSSIKPMLPKGSVSYKIYHQEMCIFCFSTSAVSVNDPGVSMIMKDVSHERAMTSGDTESM